MIISYLSISTSQVYCASWKPAYDIRASTAGDEQTVNSVQLCYYGLVEQNTGDDWRDTELVLSTASPSLGGAPPPLATLAASLHKPKQSVGILIYSIAACSESNFG